MAPTHQARNQHRHHLPTRAQVEILELNENNSGRDPFPVFLRRTPLPKSNMRGGVTSSTKYRKTECYSPADFKLGTYVNVYNRDFLVHDADRYTKAWCVWGVCLSFSALWAAGLAPLGTQCGSLRPWPGTWEGPHDGCVLVVRT